MHGGTAYHTWRSFEIVKMNISETLRKLLADLNEQLAANSEDIRDTSERLDELYRERIKIYRGITEIRDELKRLERSSASDD